MEEVEEADNPESANVKNADMKHQKLVLFPAETINVQNVAPHYVGLIKANFK